MGKKEDVAKHLPLSEATYYIMSMLVDPMHGYGVMQQVEEETDGAITIGPGTLYGAFSTLEKQGLIEMVCKEGRRKVYALTSKGEAVLRCQIERLHVMVRRGDQVLGRISDSAKE